MEKEPFSVKKRIHSIKYAFQGIAYLFKNEHNAWIHCFIAVCVIVAGALLRISLIEWIAVVFAIGFVLAAEALNTAIEVLCDEVSPEYRERIRHSKDVAAAGVLIAVLTAIAIGLIVFVPRIVGLIYS